MSAKRVRVSTETKAACIAALLSGQGISQVAEAYKVPEGTVKSWRARMKDGSSTVAKIATQKRDEIGGLLIEYLHANLSTLRSQQTVFSDPVWLEKQEAGELAVLHGVMTDKAIRLLEALGGSARTQK